MLDSRDFSLTYIWNCSKLILYFLYLSISIERYINYSLYSPVTTTAQWTKKIILPRHMSLVYRLACANIVKCMNNGHWIMSPFLWIFIVLVCIVLFLRPSSFHIHWTILVLNLDKLWTQCCSKYQLDHCALILL